MNHGNADTKRAALRHRLAGVYEQRRYLLDGGLEFLAVAQREAGREDGETLRAWLGAARGLIQKYDSFVSAAHAEALDHIFGEPDQGASRG